MAIRTYGLEMIRSDTGDGGWSLHAPEMEDEDGLSPALASGEAEWIGTEADYNDWSRPDQADYDAAQATRLATAR